MVTKNISLSDTKFAFSNINRTVTDIKKLRENIYKVGQVHMPIIVMTTAEFVKELQGKEGQFVLTDPMTGDIISESQAEYVVLDGQHRLKSALSISEEFITTDGNSEVYIDSIDVIVKTMADINMPLVEYIRDINSTSKVWNNKDIVKEAKVLNPKDSLTLAISALDNIGLSLSTISRYLSFDNITITTTTMNSNLGGVKLAVSEDEWMRGIRIFLFLSKLGFNVKVLKSRYIIELFIKEQKHSSAKFDEFCTQMSCLSKESVSQIEKVKGEELAHMVNEYVKQDFKAVLKAGQVQNLYSSISDADILEFISGGYEQYIPTKKVAKKPTAKATTKAKPLDPTDGTTPQLLSRLEDNPYQDSDKAEKSVSPMPNMGGSFPIPQGNIVDCITKNYY